MSQKEKIIVFLLLARFRQLPFLFFFSKLNVLSIDGGGSRGVMEAMILDDLMRLVTLMIRNPIGLEITNITGEVKNTNDEYNKVIEREAQSTSWLTGAKNWILRRPPASPKNCRSFRQKLEEIKENDLIHPTEIFDIIAGTSTGSLIAFALVDGKI